jgi:hypothetical protein
MAFCKELEPEEKPRVIVPRKPPTLEDRVAAMDWDMTGFKMDIESLKRSRRWSRFIKVVLL